MSQAAESLNTGVRTGEARATTSRCLVALVFLLTLPSVARPQEASTSELRPVDPYKISVNVSSVVLHATVENHKGAPVSGLGQG